MAQDLDLLSARGVPDASGVARARRDDARPSIWDPASAKEVVVLRGSTFRFFSAAFSPDRAVSSCDDDVTMRLPSGLNSARSTLC
jgi:hypothetical protein